jgi:hypothetical protein
MLEDLKEIRRILNKFIAKYEEKEQYFEHDSKIVELVKEREKSNSSLDGDEQLKELGRELLKIREDEAGYGKDQWQGNDIY